MKKRGFMTSFLLFLILIVLIAIAFLVYQLVIAPPQNVQETQLHQNQSISCQNLNDSFVQPNFLTLKQKLESEQILKDMPSSGRISLSFYHFAGACRVWDMSYMLSTGKIEEKSIQGDLDIWIHTEYVPMITEQGVCEIIKQARASGDLGQSVNIGTTDILLKYSGMLKYRSCLGI